jgi:hypothetical protein
MVGQETLYLAQKKVCVGGVGDGVGVSQWGGGGVSNK